MDQFLPILGFQMPIPPSTQKKYSSDAYGVVLFPLASPSPPTPPSPSTPPYTGHSEMGIFWEPDGNRVFDELNQLDRTALTKHSRFGSSNVKDRYSEDDFNVLLDQSMDDVSYNSDLSLTLKDKTDHEEPMANFWAEMWNDTLPASFERAKSHGGSVSVKSAVSIDSAAPPEPCIGVAPHQASDLVAPPTSPDGGEAHTPFKFLGLPLFCRNRIYGLILSVPVLICPRQKKTAVIDPYPISANIAVERRDLLPGVAYVLCQAFVDDHKFKFAHFSFHNVRILRVSRQVHDEAKAVLYGQNLFEITNLTNETNPVADFKIPLFPIQYQCLMQKLSIKGRSMFAFRWVLLKGHKELIKAYPALQSLTLLFEMETTDKGFAKKWARKDDETWATFVQRLRDMLSLDIYDCTGSRKPIPIWIDLRAVFDFERYDEAIDLQKHYLENVDATDCERVCQCELKRGMAEAFEMFKRGYRC